MGGAVDEREASTRAEWIYYLLSIVDARPGVATSVGDRCKVGAATKFDLMEFEILSKLTLRIFDYMLRGVIADDAPSVCIYVLRAQNSILIFNSICGWI